MKRAVMTGMAASVLVWATATAAQTPPPQDAKAKTLTLTGCLAKGEDANSFVLNKAMPVTAAKDPAKDQSKGQADAKAYHLMPTDAVKLAGHVGHTVEITGTMDAMAGGMAKPGAAGSTPAAKPGASMPHLTVTAMKHVSPTCS